MIELDERLAVARPRARVFDHLARVEALPDWLPNVRHAERLDDGPLRAGSRLRLVLAGIGNEVVATGELTELVPGTAIGFRTLDAPIRLEARCLLGDAAPGVTELRLLARIELPGLLRLGEGMARDRIRRETPAALAELRGRLEAAIPPDAPA